MRKNILLILTFIFFSLTSFSQDMTCNDYKNGKFIAVTDTEPPIEFEITRNGAEQIEVLKDPNGIYPEEFKTDQFGKIEWIDECSYKLKYDGSKMELSEFQIAANENGGSLNEIYKIEENCFYYKSTMKINGKLETMSGKICKE